MLVIKRLALQDVKKKKKKKLVTWEVASQQGNSQVWGWFREGIKLVIGGQRSLVGYTVHGVAKSWTQLSDFTFTS